MYPNLVVQPSETSAYYANVRGAITGLVHVQVCRRVLWSGRPVDAGLAASHPPRPMQRLVASATYEAPFHLVLDRVHDLLVDLELR